ncbi:MAG: hypothetical protein K2X35_20260 [Bryobacteraceae bacterium]|nr:hypothetical protein [Bryobacteraceae bacterium]
MKPPAAARTLLMMAASDRDRDFILGDLEEEFQERSGAGWWYWSQAVRSTVPLIRVAVRDGGGGRFFAAAFVSVLLSYGLIVALVIAASALADLLLPRSFGLRIAWDLITAFPFAALAGYLSVRISGRSALLQALMLAVFVGLLGLLSMAMSPAELPAWYSAGLIAAMTGGVLAGAAHFARRRTR